jgi:hypothetical protein
MDFRAVPFLTISPVSLAKYPGALGIGLIFSSVLQKEQLSFAHYQLKTEGFPVP